MIETARINVIVFGAGGNTGRCLVRAGVHLGHRVTAFVRNEDQLHLAVGERLFVRLRVIVGDALDPHAVGEAITGHDAVVNAAQHPSDPEIFEAICRTVAGEAQEHLPAPGRLWQFGGLPGLDVPHTKIIGSDLPGMRPILRSHKANYELLKKSNLDWSFICPGPMFFSGDPRPAAALRITTEVMPYEIAAWTRRLPRLAHPFIMLRRLERMVVSYEDAAHLVMSNLAPNSPYSKKRVALAYGQLTQTEHQV